jgi:hypothetical protein
MDERINRRRQVLALAAETAFKLPRLDSGFWYHQDMRDNLYYAMHLFAASIDESINLSFPKKEGRRLGEEMLHMVLSLQMKDPENPMYSHWPFNLGTDPANAAPHTLPVELLGSLLAWYHHEYGIHMNESLRLAFEEAMRHAYLGNYYRKPNEYFNHHETKYISQQLIWGELFQDSELAVEARKKLNILLSTIQANGMKEYGGLPWFWHWVQSLSAARVLVKQEESLALINEMLNYLWRARSAAYLKGAWVGAHSRVLPHDVPADRNNLIDYVEYGDFELPQAIARLEAAGLLPLQPADSSITAAAAGRTTESEMKRLIPVNPLRLEDGCRHTYTFLTPDYALGGVWERAEEYQNEQHRWDVSLPARADGKGNQAFFFRPGSGYSAGDPRHQSGGTEVLLYRNTAASLYAAADDSGYSDVLGVLPYGQWEYSDRLIAGQAGHVYLIIHLMNDYKTESGDNCIFVHSPGSKNGVVIEVIKTETAAALGLKSVTAVLEKASSHAPLFELTEAGGVRFRYTSLSGGNALELEITGEGTVAGRTVNGSPVSFADYSVPV